MATCPGCGQQNPEGFRFCGACGRPLPATAGGARGERKVVTVLFVDLVGFTARAELMDPADGAGWLAPYRGEIKEALERFGGTGEKVIGDGAMARFGAPGAREA